MVHDESEPEKSNRDKRRRVEESLALVEDPASRTGNAMDELVGTRGNNIVIEWDKIAYITLRDQVCRIYRESSHVRR